MVVVVTVDVLGVLVEETVVLLPCPAEDVEVTVVVLVTVDVLVDVLGGAVEVTVVVAVAEEPCVVVVV